MPLKRTPPSTPDPSCSSKGTAKTSSTTESPLYSVFTQRSKELEILSDSASKRVKRKFEGMDTNEKNTIIAEMRTLFSNFTDEQDKKLATLQTSIEKSVQDTISALSTDLAELAKSFDFLYAKHEETVKNIKRLETEREDDKEYILSLERSVEYLERKARSSCLEIRNMPKSDESSNLTESKAQLRDIIVNLGKTLNTEIDIAEIKDVFRLQSKKDLVKPITVEFTSVLKKEAVLSSIKKFNKDRRGSDKLNTSHLHLKGPAKPIFVSESLTFRPKQLFRLAREFKASHEYQHCWSANGVIYLRRKDGLPHIRINNESDIKKLENPK